MPKRIEQEGTEERRWNPVPSPPLQQPLQEPRPPGGAGGVGGGVQPPVPAHAYESVCPTAPGGPLRCGLGRGESASGAGGQTPRGGQVAGRGGQCPWHPCHRAVFPPRGSRMTAPTSSAGPPARAPPARSASGVTPRPHGRPSTTAVQVLGPRGFHPDEAVLLVAFPRTHLSLILNRNSGRQVGGCRW